MKRIMLIAVTLVMMCVANVAFADDDNMQNVTGKIIRIDKKAVGEEREYFDYIGIFEESNGVGYELVIKKDITKEFRACIDSGKYRGLIEVTAEVYSLGAGPQAGTTELIFDSRSTCKRK